MAVPFCGDDLVTNISMDHRWFYIIVIGVKTCIRMNWDADWYNVTWNCLIFVGARDCWATILLDNHVKKTYLQAPDFLWNYSYIHLHIVRYFPAGSPGFLSSLWTIDIQDVRSALCFLHSFIFRDRYNGITYKLRGPDQSPKPLRGTLFNVCLIAKNLKIHEKYLIRIIVGVHVNPNDIYSEFFGKNVVINTFFKSRMWKCCNDIKVFPVQYLSKNMVLIYGNSEICAHV